jgi:hypothetical protein
MRRQKPAGQLSGSNIMAKSGGTLVLLEDAADLPVHRCWIEPLL